MTVKDLTYVSETGRPVLNGVDFNLYSGEVLGIAGVEGNGQTELVEILTGLREAASGEVMVNDKDIVNHTPREIRMLKIAHIPEDRLTNGVSVNTSIKENLVVDRILKRRSKKVCLWIIRSWMNQRMV